MTQVFKIDNTNFTQIIKKAGSIIKNGGTVVFPTETVYGLGADALNPDAVAKIFQAKGRPTDNPLIVHIASKEQVHDIAKDIPEQAFELMDKFWPGALTLILKCKVVVPDITTAGLDTVAVRFPDNQIAIGLIQEAGTPIAAPSANISGRPSPTTAEHVIADLIGKVDAIIDGGVVELGVESTVVDMTSDIPVILRPGGISIDDIRRCGIEIAVGYSDRKVEDGEAVKSPGMKYTHYSPQTNVVLVDRNINIDEDKDKDKYHKATNTAAVSAKISEMIKDYHDIGMRVGLMLTEETAYDISSGVCGCCGVDISSCEVFMLGRRDEPADAARTLFAGLRYLDEMDVDIIVVDGSITHEGIGAAVLNRLRKAADEIIGV